MVGVMNEIGLIGVGLLGLAIARRLASQGRCVFGYDLDPSRRELLTAPHSASAAAQEVVDRCSVVILSLPTSEIASKVVRDLRFPTDHELLIVDTTTGSPDEMVALAQFVREGGGQYAEATVAGSSKQMRVGEATIFLGCSEANRERTQNVVDVLSERSFYLGDVGAASRFKLVHNLVLGLNRAVLAEGIVFGEAMGFDPERVLEVLLHTPAYSGVMKTKGSKMVEQNYELQARLSQHLKDVRLILEEAEKRELRTPMSETHRGLLERAEELGFGAADNSAVIEALRIRRK